MINLKIETTYDDNYSDDELTFFPYYTYLTNCDDPVKVGAQLNIATMYYSCVLFLASKDVDATFLAIFCGAFDATHL